jgi:hypothetical protein
LPFYRLVDANKPPEPRERYQLVAACGCVLGANGGCTNAGRFYRQLDQVAIGFLNLLPGYEPRCARMKDLIFLHAGRNFRTVRLGELRRKSTLFPACKAANR